MKRAISHPALKTASLPVGRHLRPAADGTKRVLGPDGTALSEADLPKQPARWTSRLKAMVIAAVEGHLITLEEARTRYGISPDEFTEWRRTYHLHGRKGLRVTHIQDYRPRT